MLSDERLTDKRYVSENVAKGTLHFAKPLMNFIGEIWSLHVAKKEANPAPETENGQKLMTDLGQSYKRKSKTINPNHKTPLAAMCRNVLRIIGTF